MDTAFPFPISQFDVLLQQILHFIPKTINPYVIRRKSLYHAAMIDRKRLSNRWKHAEAVENFFKNAAGETSLVVVNSMCLACAAYASRRVCWLPWLTKRFRQTGYRVRRCRPRGHRRRPQPCCRIRLRRPPSPFSKTAVGALRGALHDRGPQRRDDRRAPESLL